MIQKLDHLVITTSEMERCIAFYEKVGFTAKAAGERVELFAGDFKINVHYKGRELSPHARNVQTGSADLCFQLSVSLDCFLAAVIDQGLTAELGPVDRTGVRGPMRSVYLRDPDGNLVEFCSYQD